MRLALLLLALAGADEHLLAGARFFKDGKHAQALVEFRVAQKLGNAQAAWYAGAALQKLGRPEDALEAFGAAPQGPHDALLDYYRALACYDAKLYACADKLLASVGDRSGPRIAGIAKETRAKIAEALRKPSPDAVAWYRERAAEAKAAGRKTLAAAYAEEAGALEQKR